MQYLIGYSSFIWILLFIAVSTELRFLTNVLVFLDIVDLLFLIKVTYLWTTYRISINIERYSGTIRCKNRRLRGSLASISELKCNLRSRSTNTSVVGASKVSGLIAKDLPPKQPHETRFSSILAARRISQQRSFPRNNRPAHTFRPEVTSCRILVVRRDERSEWEARPKGAKRGGGRWSPPVENRRVISR